MNFKSRKAPGKSKIKGEEETNTSLQNTTKNLILYSSG